MFMLYASMVWSKYSMKKITMFFPLAVGLINCTYFMKKMHSFYFIFFFAVVLSSSCVWVYRSACTGTYFLCFKSTQERLSFFMTDNTHITDIVLGFRWVEKQNIVHVHFSCSHYHYPPIFCRLRTFLFRFVVVIFILSFGCRFFFLVGI